jgi:tetratricopeptide (TPR) repeat protein
MNENNKNIIGELKNLIGVFFQEQDADSIIDDLLKETSSNIESSPDQEKESFALDYELPNGIDYRLVVDRCVTKCETLLTEDKFFKLLLELSRTAHAVGENDLALELAQNLLNKIEKKSEYDLLQADAYLMISKIYWSQAYWDDCNYYVEEAMKIYLTNSNNAGLAKSDNMLGTLYGEKGEIALAEQHFEKALTYLSEDDDELSHSMILTNLGIINTIQGEYEKAIWNYKNALQKFDALQSTRYIARTYHNIGMLYTRMEKYDAALDEFNKCITLSLDNNYLSNCAVAYIGKAFIYTKLKNSALADAYTDKALEIACRINDTLSIADIYRIKGLIHGEMENFQLSEEMFENSIRLNKDIESKLNEAESAVEIGNLLKRTGREDESLSYFQSAMNYFKELKDKNIIAGLVEQYS